MKITKEILNPLSFEDESIVEELTAKYMEYPPNNKEIVGVLEKHEIGKPQHFDFRFALNSFLNGWAIVGFSEDQPAEISKLVPGKRFRAETKCKNEYCNEWRFRVYEKDGEYYYDVLTEEELSKQTIESLARQPRVWLFPKWKIGERHTFKPGEVGASIKKPGYMTVLARPKVILGTQKSYFHEYFLKDDKNWKDWTRITFIATKQPKLDPKTKQAIKGQFERIWMFLVATDNKPYALTTRAIKKRYKPPKSIIPFPLEWAKKNYSKEYERWIKYMKGELTELSQIDFVLSLSSYMGARAKVGRRMPRMLWWLLLDDKDGKVRTFHIDGYPLRDKVMSVFEYDRQDKKWMTTEGKIKPHPTFLPVKKIIGDYNIIDKGKCTYDTELEGKRELIKITFKGKKLRGKYELLQNEKGSDLYSMEKLSGTELEELSKGKFILDIHWFSKLGTGKIIRKMKA